MDGSNVEEVDDSSSSQEASQYDVHEKVLRQSAGDGGEKTVDNTAMRSTQETDDYWVDVVSEILKAVCVKATDRAVNQQHRFQQCLKKKTEVIRLSLTDAIGNEEKQKDINRKLMDAERDVEMVRMVKEVDMP